MGRYYLMVLVEEPGRIFVRPGGKKEGNLHPRCGKDGGETDGGTSY